MTLDFWEVTKLLGRRWRISLPMLAVIAMLAALTVTRVKPTYVAAAYVELIPPLPAAVRAGDPEPVSRNPWMNESLLALSGAALTTVQDASYVDSLRASGYSGKFTAMLGGSVPLLTLTITATSRQQAATTATQIIDRYDSSVTALQTSYGVTGADLIKPVRLDDGTSIRLSNSVRKRVLIVVAGVGMLLSAAVTIGADALLRRRRRVAESEAGFPADSATTPRSERLDPTVPAAGRVPIAPAGGPPAHASGTTAR